MNSNAYIARPHGASKSPAVIVLNDDLGLNNRFRELTRQFAQAGFVALAPHLPSRSKTPAVEPRQGSPGRLAVAGLDWYQSVDDLRAAFTFLEQDPGVDAAGWRSCGEAFVGSTLRRGSLTEDPP